MSRAQLKNPWKVESIQDFLCLKCPECVFFTKEENDFENHAVANHPLSVRLFDETMSSSEIEGVEKEKVLEDVNDYKVYNVKKEPADSDTSEKDTFEFSNTIIQQQGTHFMSSLVDNDYSFHPRNKAKKLKIEPSTNIRQHETHFMSSFVEHNSSDNDPETISVDPELQNENKLIEKNFHCPKCSFKTSKKHYLDQHVNGHNDCQYCGKVFLGSHGKAKLATHVKTHQKTLWKPTGHKVKPKKQVLCIFCNRDYKNWSNRNRHMKICKKKPSDVQSNLNSSPTKSVLSDNKSSLSSESKPKKRPRKQKIAENTNDQWKGGHFMDLLIDYDSSVDKTSFNQLNQPKKLSSCKIENSVKEEELEAIDHVNDIKKELTDQDSSKDPFGYLDANIEPRSEYVSPHTSAHLENDHEYQFS